MELIIDNEFRDLIPPLSEDEFKQLEENLLCDGIQDPLKTWNGILIDGHNRYELAQKHGLTFKITEMNFADRDEAKIWIITNQLGRRNLNKYVRSELVLQFKSIIAERSKERMLAGVKLKDPSQNSDEGSLKSNDCVHALPADSEALQRKKTKAENERRTIGQLAAIADVSRDTISKVEKIKAKASPEIKAALRTGDLSINAAYKEIKRSEKAQHQEERRQENATKVEELATPLDAKGLFQTIVIDPPWDWGDEGDVNQFGRAKPEYSTLPFAEIKNLPVDRIADKGCHLYLWVTNRSLPKAFALIEAWGFRYITCLTWVKPSIGMGNYFRGSTEHILFAVKGSQPLKRHDVGTAFNAPRGEGHSAKPDEFYSLVETCSYAPFIDIFGRKERDGWTVWGENG